VIAKNDWEQEQETLYVLQNSNLMKQIAASINTHTNHTGYKPSAGELSEITGI
jgi:antitoxin YefM